MEKIIKRTISLTTKKRDSRNKLFEEFYSHDKNNAIFEFTVENGIPTEEIVVLFHFKRTNRHLEVRGRVDNDKIIVNFDTSLIIKDEQVAGYIYYENGEKSNDVYRFMFDVHVSEIDKEHDLPIMEQESKRIVPLTDIVTKSEITELLKKIVVNEKLYDDTEIKQKIESKADKDTVQALSSKVEALETKTDNDTIYNDTELRQAVDKKADKEALLQYLPKSELTPINEKVQSLETNIGRMATQQQLESYVSKNELEQKGYLTSADTHNFALKSEIPVIPPQADLSHLATKQEIEDVVKRAELTQVTDRVQSLEARPQIDTSTLVTKDELDRKGYLTTAPDLSEYAKKSEIPAQFDSSALTERINALESKAIANGAYNDKPLLDKIHEVQESLKGFITQSSRFLTEHQSLAHLVTKDELESKGYITNHQSLEHLVTKEELAQKGYLTAHQSLESLVTKDELANKGYLTTHQDISGLVTKQELEDKHYLTAHQDVSNLATNAKVEEVENRVQTLENKPPVDLSHLATKEELDVVRGNQLTADNHNFATKEELEAVRNSQPKVDTSNFVTKEELEAKQYLKDHQPLDGYVKKSELPPQVDTSTLVSKQELTSMNLVNAEALGEVSKKMLEQTTKITALESKAEYEIHGTGMPNGTVSAPIGTTYVDTAVTNGALKWIKQSGTGNTGWKVLIGDTGWRTLNSVSKLGNSFIKIRRVNNLVTYNFGGLQWGWFGIIRRNGPGFARHNSTGERGAKVLAPNSIPEGFRSENSLIGGIYNDAGKPYGIWYLGGKSDSNYIQFSFNDPIPTDRDIGDIRVSAISYVTDEDWPTRLP